MRESQLPEPIRPEGLESADFRPSRGSVAAKIALLVVLVLGIAGTTIGVVKSRKALAEVRDERKENLRLAEALESERDEKSRTVAQLKDERDAKETILGEKEELLEEKNKLLKFVHEEESAAEVARKETEESLAREQEITADLKQKEKELKEALDEKEQALRRYEQAEARADSEMQKREKTQKEMEKRLAERFGSIDYMKLKMREDPLTLDETAEMLDQLAITLDRAFVSILGIAESVPEALLASQLREELQFPFLKVPSTQAIRGVAAAQDVSIEKWGHWHPTKKEGIEYLPLSDLGKLYGLTAAPGLLHSEAALAQVLFDKNSSTMINGVHFHLREPTIKIDGQLAVSRRDVHELIDPVLRPHLVKTPRGSRRVAVNLRDPDSSYLYEIATEVVRELERRGFEVSYCENTRLGDLDQRSLLIAMGVGDPSEDGELVGAYRTRLAAPKNLLEGEPPDHARNDQRIRADVLLAAAVHSNLLRLGMQDLGVSWAKDSTLQRAPGPAVVVEISPPTFDQKAQEKDESEPLGEVPSEIAQRIASGVLAHLLRTNSPRAKARPAGLPPGQGDEEKLSPALKELEKLHEAAKRVIEAQKAEAKDEEK